MIEHCWFDEITFVEAIARGPFAATNQGRAVFAANVYVIEHCFELAFIDAGAHFRLRIQPRADAHRLRAFRYSLDELVGNLVDDDGAARCRATLTR